MIFKGALLVDYHGNAHAAFGCNGAITACGAEELEEREEPAEVEAIWALQPYRQKVSGTEPTKSVGQVTCPVCIVMLQAAVEYLPKKRSKA